MHRYFFYFIFFFFISALFHVLLMFVLKGGKLSKSRLQTKAPVDIEICAWMPKHVSLNDHPLYMDAC